MTIKEFIESKCKNIVKVIKKNDELLNYIVKGLTGLDNVDSPVGEHKDKFIELSENLEELTDKPVEDFIREFVEKYGIKKDKGKNKERKSKKLVSAEGIEVTVKEKEKEIKKRGRKKSEEKTEGTVGIIEETEKKSRSRTRKKPEEEESQSSISTKEPPTVAKKPRTRKKKAKEVDTLTTPSSEVEKEVGEAGIASPTQVSDKKTEEKIEPKPQPIAEIIRGEVTEKPTQIPQPSTIKEEKEETKEIRSKQPISKISIGSSVGEEEPEAIVILQDGTRIKASEYDEKMMSSQYTVEEGEEVSEKTDKHAEAEGVALRRPSKPPIVPDPEIVERVKRESEERLKRKKEKKKLKGKGKFKGDVVEKIDKEKLFQGKESPKFKVGKKEKKKYKFEKYDYLDEEELQKEAEEAVRAFAVLGPGIHAKRKKKKKDKGFSEGVMEKVEAPVIKVSGAMTIENLSQIMDVPSADLIVDLMDLNIMATKNQVIDIDMIKFLAQKHGYEVELVIPEEEDVLKEEPDKPEDLVPRAPVVTVMGHVDHGKTTLLDKVRSTNVAATEAGGITQHIAAYEVNTPNGKVVFLDTPGHEAFTQMRARGAKVTDIVVLVVAADDGVQPQTIEAIDHARSAEVPIIVAINKCDKPDAQPDRVRQQLTNYGLIDEAWGGNTIMKNISARTGEGVAELLELIILQAQMMDLKANPNKKARGTVIEAEMSRHLGPVAWVLIQNGTLRTGDVVLVGDTWGRVRIMYNSNEEIIKEAPPSTPVLITGLEDLPEAGDKLVVVDDERKAKVISEKRKELKKLQSREILKPVTLEDLQNLISAGEVKKLPILIKADVQGSADVLKTSLSGLGNEEVSVHIVRAGVGEISESDVLLAQVTKAVIIGFNVSTNPRAQKMAEETGVEIRNYNVIYDVLEDVRKALAGLLKPITKEVVLGHAEIRKVFKSSAIGNIAGCFQLDGVTVRGALARVIRDGQVICEDRIASLKRLKDDVKEVSAGFECGIKLEKFEDIREGDIIETYKLEEIQPSLN